jgi:CRISPR/Cas system CSM-associated protein Csm5 (group 7 of RAMP superfamily)
MDRDMGDTGLDLKAPAIGYSIVVNMGGDRQMTVQCFVGEGEDEGVIAARIDKVFRICDRQKAKYDLEKLYKQFEESGRHLRNFLNAIPIAEKQSRHQIAALKVELAEKEAYRKQVFEEGYQKHVTAGRKGVFTPGGALAGQLRAIDSEIQKVKDKITAVPADTEQHKQKVLIDVQRYQDDLHKQRLVIDDLRKLAGLGPYLEFLDEERADPLAGSGA